MMTSDERWADLAEHAHKPTPAELDDLFRPDPLFALAQTIAAGPIVEAAAVLEQRILSLYMRGGLTDDKLVLYYTRNADIASWTQLTPAQLIGHRRALAGKLWLIAVIGHGMTVNDPITWTVAR